MIKNVIKKFGKFESITYPMNLKNNEVLRQDAVFLPSKELKNSSTCYDVVDHFNLKRT
jgi:hypothetical protein